jgi:hypothetical protein
MVRALLHAEDMDASPQTLVHRLTARRLHVDEASIRDTDRFDELGLGPLAVVLIVLQLDGLDPGSGEFPVLALAQATTVGDLVDVVETWLQPQTARSPATASSLPA